MQKEGEVSFTVRALLELEPLLKTLDDEIDNCKICGKIAVKVCCWNLIRTRVIFIYRIIFR